LLSDRQILLDMLKKLEEFQTRREYAAMSDNSAQAFSSEDFKAQQRQRLDNAAAGWHAWWPTLEHGAQKVSLHN
jgi:hypothetical protein